MVRPAGRTSKRVSAMTVQTKKKKTPSPSKKSASKKTDWPKRSDILFRPDRYSYVKEKQKSPRDCVFCTTAYAPASFKTLCLYKNKLAQVVMNKFPYNAGHLLVLPLRHEGDFLALSEDELAEVYRLKRKCIEALKKEYAPQAFNVGGNFGASAGAGIPDHLHFHIIPRWSGDTNFFPLIAETKVIIEDLEKTYERLQKYFK